MNVNELLTEIGLTERESKVYCALLELGQTTTGPLSKKSQVPNSKIYAVLESLENKSLVSWITKIKTKYFLASDPNKILDLFNEKKRNIENNINQLKILQKKSNNKNEVKMFEGMKALRGAIIEFFSDSTPDSIHYSYGTGKSSSDKKAKIFYDWSGVLKKEKKIISHLLISKKNESKFKKQHKVINHKYWKTRFSKVSFPGDVGIFQDKIIIMNWDTTPTLILIKNKSLAKEYLDFFLFAWN